jgi:hypothetical protein
MYFEICNLKLCIFTVIAETYDTEWQLRMRTEHVLPLTILLEISKQRRLYRICTLLATQFLGCALLIGETFVRERTHTLTHTHTHTHTISN